MYKKVLVPLDGSDLAQCAVNEVRNVVGEGSQVILLRVMEVISSLVLQAGLEAESPNTDLAKMERKNADSARRNLERIAAKLKKKDIEAKTAIVWGRPADMINDYASKNKVDLIVISTHGRSGISRWAFGSVADRVLRSATVPVLVVTPKGCHLS
ncbi:MAG: universal stress protein [Chloroflexota bacterium]